MLYVVRHNGPCPGVMHETFYDEVVIFKNGIGLVNKEYNRDSLLGSWSNYEWIGSINSESELPELLTKLKGEAEKAAIPEPKKSKRRPFTSYELENPVLPETVRPLIENLE